MFKVKQNKSKIIIYLGLFSLGGLPPLLGFFPKWMVIQRLRDRPLLFMLIFLLARRVITLYFYLRITLSVFFLYHKAFEKLEGSKKKISRILILNGLGGAGFGFYLRELCNYLQV